MFDSSQTSDPESALDSDPPQFDPYVSSSSLSLQQASRDSNLFAAQSDSPDLGSFPTSSVSLNLEQKNDFWDTF